MPGKEQVIEEAIRSYPASIGRKDWKYGLDDLDFEDFVPELSQHILTALAQ
jgi:hypothetical protein